jgi:hypothetical protein
MSFHRLVLSNLFNNPLAHTLDETHNKETCHSFQALHRNYLHGFCRDRHVILSRRCTGTTSTASADRRSTEDTNAMISIFISS